MYIDQKKLLEATNGGLEIILKYYPQAEKAVRDQRQKFKIRDTERTASASLKKLGDGVWVVTDWGGDSKSRNGIQICMLEDNLDFKAAIEKLAADFGLSGEAGKPKELKVYRRETAQEGDYENQYFFEYKEFSQEELKLLGPQVTAGLCRQHELFSVKEYGYVKRDQKTNELVRHVFAATAEYPIFQFEFSIGKNETWGKRLEPMAPSKADRFRYFGERPHKNYMMGLHLVQKAFKKLNEEAEPDPEELNSVDDMEREEQRVQNKKLPRVIICGGDRDALATQAATGEQVIWLNSETAQVTKLMMKELLKYAYKVYYLGDIDSTGLKVQHKLAMQHLDLHIIRLPEKLKTKRDHRGNPCKDVRDFLGHYSSYLLKELIRIAIPYRMWDEVWKKRGDYKVKEYLVNPYQTYNFLEANGFYRFRLLNVKTGYIYIRLLNRVVEEIDHVEIKAFVNQYLEGINAEPALRNTFYKSRQFLGEQSLSNLRLKDIDFTDYTEQSQFFYFQNKTWEVNAEGIIEHKVGETDGFVWQDEVIPHRVKKLDQPFWVTRSEEGEYDIEVFNTDCLFLRYLINTSRVHWQKELECKNKGEEFPEEMRQEQRRHLINKLYSLGYLLHRYKDPSRPWAVMAMDNKISEDGESHGGSGKSIAYKAVRYFMKSVTLEGPNQRLTENPHVFENVTTHTDFILVDDANKYLKFDFFYTMLTGELIVNPKHGRQYEIPYEEVPKLAITTNYAQRDDSPSTHRRVLYTVFSDYYHENKEGEYERSWSPRDEFGKNLFQDFTEDEWNLFFNTMVYALQVYLNFPKIDPPMENVVKRNQITQMGQDFKDWADVYFTPESNLDCWVKKKEAYEDFLEKNPGARRRFATSNRFTKSLKIYAKYQNWQLNPPELNPDNKGRLIRTIDGTSAEHFYLKAYKNQIIGFDGTVIGEPQSLEHATDDDLPF